MKNLWSLGIVMLFVVGLLISIQACNKPCEVDIPECQEVPPTDDACLAFFERWFYDADSNSCSQISYSGCSERGFATEVECMACECE